MNYKCLLVRVVYHLIFVSLAVRQCQAIPEHRLSVSCWNRTRLCNTDTSERGQFIHLCWSNNTTEKPIHRNREICDTIYLKSHCCASSTSLQSTFKIHENATLCARSASSTVCLQTAPLTSFQSQVLRIDDHSSVLIRITGREEENAVSREFSWAAMSDVVGITIDLLYRVIVTINYGIAAGKVFVYMFKVFGFIG